jgi:hypothetical protein
MEVNYRTGNFLRSNGGCKNLFLDIITVRKSESEKKIKR